MDTRNQKKSHPFPHELSGRVHLQGNEAFPVYLIRGERGSARIEVGISNIMNCCRLLVRWSREEVESC